MTTRLWKSISKSLILVMILGLGVFTLGACDDGGGFNNLFQQAPQGNPTGPSGNPGVGDDGAGDDGGGDDGSGVITSCTVSYALSVDFEETATDASVASTFLLGSMVNSLTFSDTDCPEELVWAPSLTNFWFSVGYYEPDNLFGIMFFDSVLFYGSRTVNSPSDIDFTIDIPEEPTVNPDCTIEGTIDDGNLSAPVESPYQLTGTLVSTLDNPAGVESCQDSGGAEELGFFSQISPTMTAN